MKTLGQMLMDAYAKADTIDTVALVGDKLRISHKPNACEQIEAAFTEELLGYVEERIVMDIYFPSDFARIIGHGFSSDRTPEQESFFRNMARKSLSLTLGIPISKP